MEEALIKRILPHSPEAEQSVIGSMIMSRDAIVEASEIITGADFYQQQYGIVFEAMIELHDEGKAVDLITLQERLKEKDLPPEISSMEFVRDLLSAVPTSANVKYYAEIVAEKSMLRKLIKTTEEITNACYLGKEKTQDILEVTEKKIFDLVQNRIRQSLLPLFFLLKVISRWESTPICLSTSVNYCDGCRWEFCPVLYREFLIKEKTLANTRVFHSY